MYRAHADLFFQGTHSRIGGVTFEVLAQEAYDRHFLSYSERTTDMLVLRNPGTFHWRSGGEKHINDPLSIANLQVRWTEIFLMNLNIFKLKYTQLN